MMTIIYTALGFVIGMLLCMVIMMVLMTNAKIVKWFTKRTTAMMNNLVTMTTFETKEEETEET